MASSKYLCAILIIIGSILLIGCTAQSTSSPETADQNNYQARSADQNGNPVDYQGRQNRQFGNMSEEQRNQFMEERQRLAIDACQGKAEGDKCTIQTQRNNATGVCRSQNVTFECVIPRPNKRMPGSG